MLTQEQAAQLVLLLDLMEWSPSNNVPLEVFLALNRNTVFPGIDLALIRHRAAVPEVFLTQRPSNDPYFANMWHLPGAIVVPGATAETTIEVRVLWPDIGISLSGTPDFLMVRDILKGPPGPNHSPRGQEVYRLYQYVLRDEDKEEVETETRKFFPLDQIPEPFIAHQLPSIEKLRAIHRV